MARGWFYNIPYHGHVNPTLSLMRELVNRGDEITYFSGPAFADRVQATGALARNYDNLDAFGHSRNVTHAIHQGVLVAEATYALLPQVLSSIEAERPDYLMFDMSAPWGGIASRRFNIPAIACFPHLPYFWRMLINDRRVLRKVLLSLRPGFGYYRQLQRQTRKIVKDYNLRKPADINVLSSSAELNIAFLTRYYQPYQSHFDDSYVYVGPKIETDRREEPLSLPKQAGQTLIYIAVGTVYKANVQFFKVCMEALADARYSVIMSIGKAVDPSSLGEIPDNFTVAQYVPQLQILQAADIFITHGGMNSINEAVTYGVPMIVVPNTVEQSVNAARIEEIQCGLYLDQAQLTVAKLQTAVTKILSDPHTTSGLSRLLNSFNEAGGTPLAADVINQFKQKHGIN
jgi:MGT family glycosyltransferase